MKDDRITVAKAIGIILMVLAHSGFSIYANQFINMFHMPLFFFFSGYCFKEKYLQDWKGFTTKRIKGVYIPFVKWSLLFLLLHNVFFHLNIYNGEYGFRGSVSYLYTFSEFAPRALHIVTRMTDEEQLLGGYWFLHSLLFGAFFFYMALRLIRNPLLGGVILLMACLLFIVVNKSLPYFHVGYRDCLAAFFMMMGFWYKQTNWQIEEQKWYLVIPLSLAFVILGTHYWQCGMLTITWQKLLPYSATALAGILMVFAISRQIVQKKKPIQVITIVYREQYIRNTYLAFPFV